MTPTPRIDWRHKDPNDALLLKPHAAEAHYDGTGHWVCYVCRGAVNDGGRAIEPGMKGLEALTGPLTADPERPGLNTEGS